MGPTFRQQEKISKQNDPGAPHTLCLSADGAFSDLLGGSKGDCEGAAGQGGLAVENYIVTKGENESGIRLYDNNICICSNEKKNKDVSGRSRHAYKRYWIIVVENRYYHLLFSPFILFIIVSCHRDRTFTSLLSGLRILKCNKSNILLVAS